MSKKTRRELTQSLRPVYAEASWQQRSEILDNFVTATGYDRKYAVVLLNRREEPILRKRNRPCQYDEDFQQLLYVVWLASNRLCSKRLAAAIPELVRAMESHGHLALAAEQREKLLAVSPATMDRLLRSHRQQTNHVRKNTQATFALKESIPVRTDWNLVPSGFCEADLVAHCGGNVTGQFLWTLTVTDIATGWTELACVHRDEREVVGALRAIRQNLPAPLRGLDTDNGGEFINYQLKHFCDLHGVEFTRSRAYKKNDQAHVEQKNGNVVRKIVGYDRMESPASEAILTELYEVARLYLNFFQPCFKLVSKQRLGGKTKKIYDKPQTPYQRILDSIEVSDRVKARLRQTFATLDPVDLLHQMECLQRQAWDECKQVATVPGDAIQPVPTLKRSRRQYDPKPVPHKKRGPKPKQWLLDEIALELEKDAQLGYKRLYDLLLLRHDKRSLPTPYSLDRHIRNWKIRNGYETTKSAVESLILLEAKAPAMV